MKNEYRTCWGTHLSQPGSLVDGGRRQQRPTVRRHRTEKWLSGHSGYAVHAWHNPESAAGERNHHSHDAAADTARQFLQNIDNLK